MTMGMLIYSEFSAAKSSRPQMPSARDLHETRPRCAMPTTEGLADPTVYTWGHKTCRGLHAEDSCGKLGDDCSGLAICVPKLRRVVGKITPFGPVRRTRYHNAPRPRASSSRLSPARVIITPVARARHHHACRPRAGPPLTHRSTFVNGTP